MGRCNIFGRKLLQERKSPCAIILTEPVPDMFEFRPTDWPISEEVHPGDSVAFLYQVFFFIDLPWLLGDSRGEFQKKSCNEA